MTTAKYKVFKEGQNDYYFYGDFKREFSRDCEIGFREKIPGALNSQKERDSYVYDINNTAMILTEREYPKNEGDNLILIGDEKNFSDIENKILEKFNLIKIK